MLFCSNNSEEIWRGKFALQWALEEFVGAFVSSMRDNNLR